MLQKSLIKKINQSPYFLIQISYVESGIFEAEISGNKKILTTGDPFFVTSNVVYAVVCLEPGCLIDVFNPMREDFIKTGI